MLDVSSRAGRENRCILRPRHPPETQSTVLHVTFFVCFDFFGRLSLKLTARGVNGSPSFFYACHGRSTASGVVCSRPTCPCCVYQDERHLKKKEVWFLSTRSCQYPPTDGSGVVCSYWNEGQNMPKTILVDPETQKVGFQAFIRSPLLSTDEGPQCSGKPATFFLLFFWNVLGFFLCFFLVLGDI